MKEILHGICCKEWLQSAISACRLFIINNTPTLQIPISFIFESKLFTIRERAGATLLASSAETSIDVVRIERRKELAFENKTYWDLKRWRIIDDEHIHADIALCSHSLQQMP